MTWMLFLDESGHDHKQMPFEVRGGIALPVPKLWDFVQLWRRLEEHCFGALLADYGKEAKGSKLLDRDRLKWAAQAPVMPDDRRQKQARAFLEIGRVKGEPKSENFAAYGQASVEMARGAFDLLRAHDARLFASLIPRGVKPPKGFIREDYLRKDHVFLLERYFYFLERERAHGLLVMDQTEKAKDRAFVTCLTAYFRKTATGRNRSAWIVPTPIFVDSDMSYAVQAADLCLYCINWGFRLPSWGDYGPDYEIRQEIYDEFGPKVAGLQWHGDGYREQETFRSHGIVLVRDPYEARA
ncbi:DUF3800 domain-containing protein [Hoeflea sp.]|uniref:DUF3800 domain-containing protein n=1 Tax=Hoeflea sp. TaxID=1940281 RepID=UPI003B014A8E